MENRSISSFGIRFYSILFILGILILIFTFSEAIYRLFGVPCLLLILFFYVIYSINKTKAKKKQSVQEKSSSQLAILNQAQKVVENSASDDDLAVIGTEYRQQQHKLFEKVIDALLDDCLRLIHSHIKAHTIAIFFPTDDGGYHIRRYLSHSDLINKEAIIYPGVGIIGAFLKDGLKKLKLTDIVTDSMTLYYYQKDAGIRSLLAVPIVADQQTKGIIIVDSTQKNNFTDDDHAYLSIIANLGGQSIYNSYLYNQYKLNHARIVAMSRTEKYFFQEQNIEGVLDKLIEIIPFAFHCDRLTISLLAENHRTAVIRRVWGNYTEDFLNLSFSLDDRSLANIVYTKYLCLFRNFSTEHYEIRYDDKEKKFFDFKSFLAFPIGVEKCKGMILLESLSPNNYHENSVTLLSRLVSSACITIEKIQILKQTENLAIRDGLTGLYNHRQFQHLLKEAITRTIRFEQPLALVISDIDYFKRINDTYGHRFGDTVLKAIATKLQRSIREGIDNTARYGGEEFALILAETDSSNAMETVERIRKQIEEMVFQNPKGQDMQVTLSFGIAIYRQHAKNQELLIRCADKALYKAKRNGRNRVELYFDLDKE